MGRADQSERRFDQVTYAEVVISRGLIDSGLNVLGDAYTRSTGGGTSFRNLRFPRDVLSPPGPPLQQKSDPL
jgi:hypothetical protein